MIKKRGQVLVLVLLVVVVALAIGLSVASRNITNIKTATQSERSQRAFSAAEGGVEDVLSRLNNVASDIATGSLTSGCPVVSGTATCSVTVGEIGATVTVNGSRTYESTVELGTVGQVDLKDVPGGTQIRIEWSKCAESSNPATIEVIEYYQPSVGTYSQNRQAWQGVPGRSGESGSFSTPSYNLTPCPHTDYLASTVFNVDSSALGTGKYLRIRPFWSRASVKVTALSGSIPLQTFNLESTARTGEGLTRKISVTRNALPALPAAFDYALFSSGSITK